jgi:hypothetical protein
MHGPGMNRATMQSPQGRDNGLCMYGTPTTASPQGVPMASHELTAVA